MAQVVSLQKISEQRVSRTVYDYTFKVVLASPSKDLARAQAVLVEAGAGTTILAPVAYFGAVTKAENATSSNTVTLRHDRTQPFDLTALRWTVSTYVTPTQPAMAMHVTQAELDPAVLLADGALTADPVNPLILIDATGNWAGAAGTVLRFDGTVRKVLRVEVVRGLRRLVTEEVPFVAAFKQLSYRASLSPLAEASLQPADSGQAAPAGAGKSRGALGRRFKLGAGDSVLVSKLQAAMLVGCITPVPAVEGETGELTVKFEFDCAISDLAAAFGKSIPNVGRIYGNVEHTAKDEHVFSLADKNDYVVSKVEVKSDLGIELSAAGVLPAWQTEGGSGCQKSTTGTECKFKLAPLLHFERLFIVNGVPVPITADLDLVVVVDLAGSGGFKAYAEQSRTTIKGVRAGVKVDELANGGGGAKPSLHLQGGVAPSADFSAEAGIGFDSNLDLGSLKFKALEGFPALQNSSLININVFAGGYARAQPDISANQTLCTKFDAGLKAKGEVTLIKSELLASLGFEGIPFPEAEYYWVKWKQSYPNDCAATLDSERVKLVAKLEGTENYSVNLNDSAAGLDVLAASGQWLKDKVANGQRFSIDLTRTLTENPAFKNLVVEQILDDTDFGIGGEMVRSGADSDDKGGTLKYEFSAGRLQPGDKLRLRFKAYQSGKEAETFTLRGLRIEFEIPPTAQPTYEFRRTAAGETSYAVNLGFLADSRARVTSARIERVLATATATLNSVDGVVPVSWGYEQTGPASSAWALNARQEIGGAGRLDDPAARPAFLLLETMATEGIPAVYRIPILENATPRVDEISFDKPTHLVLQTVKVSIRGGNLPPELKLVLPWCTHVEEVDYDAEARRIGNEYSNVERHFTCIATTAGEQLPVTVLNGLGTAVHAVEGPLGFPTAYAGSALVQGEEGTFGLTWGDRSDLWNNPAVRVVWDFGQGVVSALVTIYDEVTTVFTTAGEKVLQLVYSIFGEVFASRPTQAFTVQPGSGISVTAVSPLTAAAGVTQTFDVVGANMPLGLAFTLKDCDNPVEVEVGTNPSLRRFTCTFAPTAAEGSYDGSVASGNSIFGPAPYFEFKVSVSRVVLNPVQPAQTMRSIATSFEFTGQNLPTTGLSVVPVGNDGRSNCQAPHNATANGFGVACELFKVGPQVLEVRHGSQVLGSSTVTVASNVTGVTWTSPSTANSGTVKFGETVTFAVHGENLTTDPVMGFAVEKCGVSNEEVGLKTATQRTFSCWFNNQAGALAGQMPGVVKDAPGGQVLFDGWKVPVEVAGASGPSDTLEAAFGNSPTPSAPWSFGWQSTNGAAPTPYGKFTAAGSRTDYPTLAIWNKSEGTGPTSDYPYVYKNIGTAPVFYRADVTDFPAQSIIVTPGSARERAVFRWTAPAAGAYEIGAWFELMQGGSVDVRVQKNGTDLFATQIAGKGSVATAPVQTVVLAAGDAIDFAVGDGGNTNHSDITRVSASVKAALNQRIKNPANGSEYEVVTCGTWTQCRDAARAKGGELALIRSRAENDWIVANVLPTAPIELGAWIDLTFDSAAAAWSTSSGAPVTYFNWSPGNPNNSGGLEIYGMIYNHPSARGLWNDANIDGSGGVDQAIVEYRVARSGIPIAARDALGTTITVPGAVTTCAFSAAGTWNYGNGMTAGPNGVDFSTNDYVRLLDTAPWFSLIAKTASGYVAIGSGRTVQVTPGQSLAFMINEGVRPGVDPYLDNAGALSLSYSCS